jgi:hypothetical protein
VDVTLLVSLSRGNSCGHDGCNDYFSRILYEPEYLNKYLHVLFLPSLLLHIGSCRKYKLWRRETSIGTCNQLG